LFGIANQLLAAIALCLATTILLKMQLKAAVPRLHYVLVTFLPLLALLAITLTASAQKIWHPNVRIGFLAKARAIEATGLDTARAKIEHFNQLLDAAVAGTFIFLVLLILALSAREWILLLARRRIADLKESEPVWLDNYQSAKDKPLHILSLFALLFALARELSGEAAMEREITATTILPAATCTCENQEAGNSYVAFTTRRYGKGINRCC
jgi:carbon starvation protein